MKGLTVKQRRIADYIREFVADHRHSPNYREIANHFGLASLGSVHKYIQILKNKGVLADDRFRTLTLIEGPRDEKQTANNNCEIPFIGIITENKPIQTFSHPQMIHIPQMLIENPEKTYALQVKGHFLNEEMIADGDMLIIEAKQDADPGDVVIASINEAYTVVKRYQFHETSVQLVGCYHDRYPILLRPEDIEIQGILLTVIRTFSPRE